MSPYPQDMVLERTQWLRPHITSHGLADYPPGATFGPRLLVDYEFVWIVEGRVVWLCDGGSHDCPPGTVLLARPGMRDGFRWDPHQRTRHGFFHFTLEAGSPADPQAVLPDPGLWPKTLRLPPGDILRPLFHHLDWLLWHQPADWRELSTGTMRQALLAYICGTVATVSEPMLEVHPVIERAMALVRDAWSDGVLRPVSLDRLARSGGVSRAHLVRLFTRDIGATPVEALRIMRLDRAAGLLARTNLTIQAIAESCGFPNAFHFSRVFRQHYGSSPRAFRHLVAQGMHLPVIPLVRIRDLSARVWRRQQET